MPEDRRIGDPDLLRWLGEGWGEALAQVVESMAGERPSVAWAPSGGEPAGGPGAGALLWRQDFDLEANAGAWATVAEDGWRSIGLRALAAAGEETSDEDVRTTCQEIIVQSFALLAQQLGQTAGRPVATAAGRLAEAVQEGARGGSVLVSFPGAEPVSIELVYTEDLLRTLARPEQALEPLGQAAARQPEAAPAPMSATLDLLRDVELPVSVSFGRAQMALQEVLKLAAGSVIELDRTVNEPVSLIVNNTVVALGEVVVIEGNYGVRIQEIMCREKLLRSSGLG